MTNTLTLFDEIVDDYISHQEDEMSVQDYLEICKTNPMAYATAAERMVSAIGEPKLIDTSKDPRLGRIFQNSTIRIYTPFEEEFFGMESTIEEIARFYKSAAQGLEERKQILYLLGPVGGGKSSLSEKLKSLMEIHPIYIIKDSRLRTESPLGLFNKEKFGKQIEKNFGIPERYLGRIMSPHTAKRLREFKGDITRFKVCKIWPSKLHQLAITKIEPGDPNTQDVSSLIGKVEIRQLEFHNQSDPDAYAYSGGLCLAEQGIMEFVEMFKADPKLLHPMLTATQEGNYNNTEGAPIPYTGMIIAHSNESEWEQFKGNKRNEAFLDRISLIKVPYCLRTTEEVKIYAKMLRNSELCEAKCAPKTLDIMAEFAVMSRLKEHENSDDFTKMRIYDGENLKDTAPNAKSIQEYRDKAGVTEGMAGFSTRSSFKILSKVFNFDSEEVAADPVHLLTVLKEQIKQEQLGDEKEKDYLANTEILASKYGEYIGKELQTAYLESYHEYGQNIFDRYVMYADCWISDTDYKDNDTGEIYNKEALNEELSKIEKPAGISSTKDFRNEVVNYAIRQQGKNKGKNPSWTSYEKIRDVIEKKMFASTEELLPIISFTAKGTKEDQRKHEEFVQRMVKKGYTERQVRRLVEWYQRWKKHN